MAFKARKTREKKKEPLVKGKPLIPSAAIDDWYASQIRSIIQAMSDDYRDEIISLMELPGTTQYLTSDAKYIPKLPINRFKKMFMRLLEKWTSKIFKFSEKTSEECSIKVDKHSFTSVGASLKSLGIKEPKNTPRSEWETRMQLYVQQNVSLIKSISKTYTKK